MPTSASTIFLNLWLVGLRALDAALGGQAQQGCARCQPQSKSDHVQDDPPPHAVYDVVIFCIHNRPLLFSLLDAEATPTLAPLHHLRHSHMFRYETRDKKVPVSPVVLSVVDGSRSSLVQNGCSDGGKTERPARRQFVRASGSPKGVYDLIEYAAYRTKVNGRLNFRGTAH